MKTNKHLNQCKVNHEFLSELTKKFPDIYFDWKITVIFYCATHIIRGLALSEGKSLGNRNKDVFQYLESTDAGDKIKDAFKILYRNSRDVRYGGFTTRDNFERLCKIKFEESKQKYSMLRSWLEGKGVKVEAA